MRVRELRGWSGHLVELAWELNELGFDSVVRLPPAGRPSVEIFLPPGRPRATTEQRGRTSVFTWNRSRDRPPHTRHGRTRPNPERPGHDRPGYDRSGHDRPDPGRPEPGPPDPGRPEHDRAGYDRPDPERSGHGQPERDRWSRSGMRAAAERILEAVR